MKKHISFLMVFVLLVACLQGCKEDKIAPPKPNYPAGLSDRNPLHLKAAKKNGVSPIADRNYDFVADKRLVQVEDTKYLHVTSLSHSVPFLVPKAHELLNDIARNFNDSLAALNVRPYQLNVTSLLRTQNDVERLMKRNRNASPNSAHCYGTTFDIAYNSFSAYPSALKSLSYQDLKEILARVIYKLRKEQRCYVLLEKYQKCIHITVR